jgi:cytochrome c peroxidase
VRRLTLAAIAIIPIAGVIGWATSTRHMNDGAMDATAAVRASLDRSADSLDHALVALDASLASARGKTSTNAVQSAFRIARTRYKHIEGALEFYAPALAAAFNSRRQEVDDDDAPPPATLAASGFPALETLLWPTFDAALTDSARKIIVGMRPLVTRIHTLTPELRVTDAQIIELTRLEIARVSSLGIAGFDTPLTRDATSEAASALDGLRDVDSTFGRTAWPTLAPSRHALDASLASASAYLRHATGFETFNRLAFITFYSVPTSNALDGVRRAAHTTPIRIPRAWRVDAPSIYSANAFDVSVYAPTTAPRSTPALVALGARLFAEPKLSGTGARSCASCHQPGRAFSDGLARAASIGAHRGVVARNTPTLLNVALQPSQFADERAVTLEDQVLEVLRSPTEMGSSAQSAAVTLGRDSSYQTAFASAFGSSNDSGVVSALRVRQSIAAYLRSLTSLDSRFDRAIAGDTLAMTADERRGFNVFMSKGGCGTCHFAPLFSGDTPPLYLSSDVEVIGTTTTPTSHRVDPDSGRARIDQLPLHLRAFKTPSLRNVARTAPYMHNGTFRTLDDVLAFYDRGGGNGSGASVPNQTLAADSLHLSNDERRTIIAFLSSLNSGGAR